jgi:LmbE family N-acetylglucosaminyl deacetylase
VRQFKPSFIITHAYEGGHPDHDTAVVVARVGAEIAARQTGNPPELLEMTGYHAVEGTRVTGQFLTGPRLAAKDIEPAVEIKMSIEERRRKARMLGCYVSQWHVLSGIPLEPERLRPAPLYDFTRPPHEGTLWYETLGWPLSGARWRELAAQVLAEFGRLTCR